MVGTSILHDICGKVGVFDTEEEATDCANNNIRFKLYAGIVVGVICMILGTIILGLFIPNEYSYKSMVLMFIVGFVAAYLNSHMFPLGPVYQYNNDVQEIKSRLRNPNLMGKKNMDEKELTTHAEDIRFAKADLIRDRQSEQSLLNQRQSRYASINGFKFNL
jgi:uncharacterized membrane protein YgaE (UPF0421/DUF939 family)